MIVGEKLLRKTHVSDISESLIAPSLPENFPERRGWNSSLNEENVIKCLHRKTGEDYPLRELV